MSCLALSLQPANGSDADADSIASLGDDPLTASSGQLIVGVESWYCVVYCLVNLIYVLGITTADQDEDKSSVNVFTDVLVSLTLGR
ncbi:hypothetical protein CFP56_015141 [Quercus suber]|uniref:Uncharacterized protein n=1 Tax=Quercus suber TaxID=58331 RepID=A0AAW0KU88_QUESU|nr:hypothetical protein CFP56_28301 [Quercus suber]POE97452.1 hypothetical protein CFP56_05447 [Quercus suber]